MRLAPWLLAAAALALAFVCAGVYFVSPRVETVTVTRTVVKAAPIPERPTLAELQHALGRLHTVADQYTLVADVTMHCWAADSTFDPEAWEGIEWQAQWCWKVPQAEAIAGGLVG